MLQKFIHAGVEMTGRVIEDGKINVKIQVETPEDQAKKAAADLARHKKEIKKIIENEIISRFFFQKGRVEASLKNDPYIIKAKNILSDSLKYNKILNK